MFGISIEKLVVMGVFAIVILGPERLPAFAAKLAGFVKALKRMADGAKDRMREEMGSDFDDVDWKKLDPRQYDPRQIIRQALIEDAPVAVRAPEQVPGGDREEAGAGVIVAKPTARVRSTDPISTDLFGSPEDDLVSPVTGGSAGG